MGFFNFLQSNNKQEPKKTLLITVPEIGRLEYIDSDEMKNRFELRTEDCNPIIGKNYELLFPSEEPELSQFQIDYYLNFLKNWPTLKAQIDERLKREKKVFYFRLTFLAINEQGKYNNEVEMYCSTGKNEFEINLKGNEILEIDYGNGKY
jgi:hypothetical protein